jgi:enterochelin esterase family protein
MSKSKTNPLLQRAMKDGTPVLDGGDATFLWQGERPPQLIGDFTGWEHGDPLDLEAIDPGVWALKLPFPDDAYLEYAFWLDGQRVADPLNPHTTPDGFGHDNHYFYMPGASPTSLIRRRRVARGELSRYVVEDPFLLAGSSRPVYLYRPAAAGPYPLLVVLDGQDYRRRAKLTNMLDHLIAQDRIRPLALALLHHGGRARGVEYACSEATLGVLTEYVLPLARRELDLVDVEAQPGAYGVLGASMGGLMALYAGLRMPHVLGHVLSQSGAFTLGDHDTVVWDLVRHGPRRSLRIWMDVGRYEWLLDCNRRMHDLLVERGYEVRYQEYNTGHNYPAWRDRLPEALLWLLGRRSDVAPAP